MAYLDNTVITVDAVLTKLGRERLSQGNFQISKWAVSDDEIDYSLYNTAHPLGTDYYSNIIENMPVLEAIPDESQALRYKLRSGDPGGLLPVIEINGTDGGSISTLTSIISPRLTSNTDPGESQAIFPTTTNGNFSNERYVITLFNENIAELVEITGTLDGLTSAPSATTGFSTGAAPVTTTRNYSTTQVRTLSSGGSFAIRAKKGVRSQATTKVRVTGEESGATKTLSITINPES
jgi:hypothetical protein